MRVYKVVHNNGSNKADKCEKLPEIENTEVALQTELLHRKEVNIIPEENESDEDEFINLIPQDTTMKTNLTKEDIKQSELETAVTVNRPVKLIP